VRDCSKVLVSQELLQIVASTKVREVEEGKEADYSCQQNYQYSH